jgi:hypothetical protein
MRYIAILLDSGTIQPMQAAISIPIQFPSGNTLVLHSMDVAILYTIAYNAIILDQNGQLLLDFSA